VLTETDPYGFLLDMVMDGEWLLESTIIHGFCEQVAISGGGIQGSKLFPFLERIIHPTSPPFGQRKQRSR